MSNSLVKLFNFYTMFRSDFPIFSTHPETIYLDSASTAQKPKKVIDSMSDIFSNSYANIHRGSYDLSERSEMLFESSKEKVREFLSAQSQHEIIYTYNATYAFNLLARSLVKSGLLGSWDTILLSRLEHHANIVPWQIIAEEYEIKIEWIAITPDGRINMDDLAEKISWAKLVSLSAASNVTGATLDFVKLREITNTLTNKPLIVIDGSQSFPHFAINVVEEDIDFLIATWHKVMSDTGIGILYGKKQLLQNMKPALCGGGAINTVSESGYEPAWLPYRYEPGTPHIAWAASLLASLEYIESVGWYEAIESYEKELVEYTLKALENLPSSVRLVGPKDSKNRLGVFSFFFENHHPRDVADMLAEKNICVRAGHHCTEPLHNYYNLPATLRMSLYIYNTREDIDTFIENILEITRS